MIALTDRFTAAMQRELRARAIFEAGKLDPHTYDRSTLAPVAVRIAPSAWRAVAATAEAAWRELESVESALRSEPRAWSALGIGRRLRLMLRSTGTGGRPHPRVCRIDLHPVAGGWAASEVNADVPGGFIEAGAITRLVAQMHPGLEAPPDPAESLASAVASRLERGVVAMVHATSFVDDQQVMRRIGAALQARGIEAVLSSPAHLARNAAGCRLLHRDATVGAVVRFFPAEWMATLPGATRRCWSGLDALLPQANPLTALLLQSKRLPLAAQSLGLRTPVWDALLPRTASLGWRRLAPRLVPEGWVLKPTWGRVGEGVCIPGATPAAERRRAERAARLWPHRWVLQRRFDPVCVGAGDEARHLCLGVFVIDGRAAGAYARIAPHARIDAHAQDAAVLLDSTLESEPIRKTSPSEVNRAA